MSIRPIASKQFGRIVFKCSSITEKGPDKIANYALYKTIYGIKPAIIIAYEPWEEFCCNNRLSETINFYYNSVN